MTMTISGSRYAATILPLSFAAMLVWIYIADIRPCESGYGTHSVVIRTTCKETLQDKLAPILRQQITEVRDENGEIGIVPSQAECRRILIKNSPELGEVGCPLATEKDKLASYLINPRVFIGKRDWKRNDVIACDSEPRHITSNRGPGTRLVVCLAFDGSVRFAKVSGGETKPTRISAVLHDFAAGINGADEERVWDQFSEPLPFTHYDFIGFYLRAIVAMILGCLWGLYSLASSHRRSTTDSDGLH